MLIPGVRNEVKGAGILDSRENCWKFFIDRVRRQLRVVLCFSPVGSIINNKLVCVSVRENIENENAFYARGGKKVDKNIRKQGI